MKFKNGKVEMITDSITISEILGGKSFVIASIKDSENTNLYLIPEDIYNKDKPQVREQVFFILDNKNTIEVPIGNNVCTVYTGISSISAYRIR